MLLGVNGDGGEGLQRGRSETRDFRSARLQGIAARGVSAHVSALTPLLFHLADRPRVCSVSPELYQVIQDPADPLDQTKWKFKKELWVPDSTRIRFVDTSGVSDAVDKLIVEWEDNNGGITIPHKFSL